MDKKGKKGGSKIYKARLVLEHCLYLDIFDFIKVSNNNMPDDIIRYYF